MTGEIVIKLSSPDFPAIDAEAIEVPLTTGPEELTVYVIKESIDSTFLDAGRRAKCKTR